MSENTIIGSDNMVAEYLLCKKLKWPFSLILIVESMQIEDLLKPFNLLNLKKTKIGQKDLTFLE